MSTPTARPTSRASLLTRGAKRFSLGLLTSALAVTALAGASAAQAAGESGAVQSDAAQSNAAGAQPAPGGAAAASTPEQMIAGAASIIRSLTTAEQVLRQKLSQAREDKDVVKTLCLDDKHGQSEVALRTAKDRQRMLLQSAKAGALERAGHEYSLMGVLLDRVNTLVAEASRCIGEEAEFTSDSESDLKLEIEEDTLPPTDPNVLALLPVIIISPSVSSPVD
jgi:organic hydroperoxide reductase OsmC/OhrA